ncbi:hypothetical protein COMNV_00485 [Commensalibacter sp. Nvir]|nr:hypothetical protein COMNV_00485 [Commensalibacter sp. Nvir]
MMNKNEKPIRKTISLPSEMWQAIEDFQFENRIKKETEAVRKLIDIALKSTKKIAEN